MMKNHGLGKMTAAVWAAFVISALFLIAVGILTRILIDSTGEEARVIIASAKRDVLDGELASAHEKSFGLTRLIKNRSWLLMLFFDHEDVLELINKADTALDMCEAGDLGLAVMALGDLENALQAMMNAEKVNLANLI